jgi:hypothetical protein
MVGNKTWLHTSGLCHRSSSTSTLGEYNFHCIEWGYSSYLNLGGELMLCKVVKFVFVISCFTALMLWSLVLLSPRTVRTQSGPGFSYCATLTSFLL